FAGPRAGLGRFELVHPLAQLVEFGFPLRKVFRFAAQRADHAGESPEKDGCYRDEHPDNGRVQKFFKNRVHCSAPSDRWTAMLGLPRLSSSSLSNGQSLLRVTVFPHTAASPPRLSASP